MSNYAYIRVSTELQNTDRQLANLEEPIKHTFVEKLSGKDVERPQLQLMLNLVEAGDVIYVHSLDRLSRNTRDLLDIVETLKTKGVTLHVQDRKLELGNKSDPTQEFYLTMLGALADMERKIMLERQREGIAIAKQKGKYKGSKKKLSIQTVNEIKAKIAAGQSKNSLAKEYSISRASLYNYLAVDKTK